ncbi:MAG TPA: helix-turn-helix transcriptional regulator [Polyangiaceae bacterium]|jgi:AraC-like DNA-binding protein
MRRVDWPIVIGPALPFTFDRRPSGVVSVLAAADELASYRDVDTIARRAVELARDRLGLERVALFLLGDDDQFYGTFGTGARGETTDERDIVFAVGDSHREAISQSLAGVSRWTVLKDVPLLTQVDGRTLVIGRGWNAITPARSGGAAVGLFVNDAALGLAPLDESKQVQLAVLATIVANLLELKRRDADALPWAAALSGTSDPRPCKPSKALSKGVAQALERIRADAGVSSVQLARGARMTPKSFAKQFRAQIGVSVVGYRNRVRIERFLGLVDLGGGNLLAAALDAGFGSYAQFHRVFRRLLGVTPKEYLTGRSR